MSRPACLLTAWFFLIGQAAVWSEEAPPSRKKLPDGVYAVQRDSLKEKELLPLKAGEVLVVDHHRYVKKDENEPPRFVVVHAAPEVARLRRASRSDETTLDCLRRRGGSGSTRRGWAGLPGPSSP